MEEQNKPVEKTPDAGTGTPESAPAPKDEKGEKSELDAANVIALIEEQDKALAAAEKKIISLKREKKGEGDEFADDDLRQEISSLREEVETLKGGKRDHELDELQKLRKRNAELIESLKAKYSISNAALGTNQSPPKPKEEDVTKSFAPKDFEFMRQRAERLGMTLEAYIKAKNIKP